MGDEKDQARRRLRRWLVANATPVASDEKLWTYRVENRRQPYTVIDADGRVIKFLNDLSELTPKLD